MTVGFKELQNLEIAFTVQFGIYSDLVQGNKKEEAVAKRKTRSRMRSRLENNTCIGC